MSRRIDIELTSRKDDTTFTWRAAGAKEPRGTVAASVVGTDATVGTVLKVDAEFGIDGIEILGPAATKERRDRRDEGRIEILGTQREERLVSTNYVEKPERGERRGDRRSRGDRPERPDRPEGRRPDRPPRDQGRGASRAERTERQERSGEGRRERPRRERPAERTETRPKAKRLRPQRTHRNAVLDALPAEQRPIAEQVLLGGVPGVRKAIEDQNAKAKEAGGPVIDPGPLVALAEQLLPRLRAAEWRDRAEAALAGADDIDVRDIRSVVVAADTAARDEATRELAEQLRAALTRRVDHEHGSWLDDLNQCLVDGRTVRALRLSSRPPKAGAPLPADVVTRLVEAATAGLTAEIAQERFAVLVEALAFSPVRQQVTPLGVPAQPSEELLAVIRRSADRIPHIAGLFGITAPAAPPARPRRGPGRPRPQASSSPALAPAAESPSEAAGVPEVPEAVAEPEVPEAEASAGSEDAQDAGVGEEVEQAVDQG
jgi:hypothetical protein